MERNINQKDKIKASKEKLKELMSFLSNKGFIWGPSPEIYGGMAGFYTYGPLGKLLKNNIESIIKNKFSQEKFWEVEIPIIQPEEVWKASGHLESFTDPLIKCEKCKSIFRADNLIEELYPDLPFKIDEILKIIEEKNIKCPSCKSDFIKKIEAHNLMMQTKIGLDKIAYNRPETATTTYLPFKRYTDFFRTKLPFGVFQIGKAFRNEISPRQMMMRLREFTQAEAQLFIFKDDKDQFEEYERYKDLELNVITKDSQETAYKVQTLTIEELYEKKYIKNKAYAYALGMTSSLFLEIGFPKDKMRLRQHTDDEKAFYADDAWDIEFFLNTFGWYEIVGIHDRTDYDLKQHSKHSGIELTELNEKTGKRETPHVIEIAFGIDRPLFALLDMFYEKKEISEGKNIFAIPAKLAPIKVAVFPLMKKPDLIKKAEEIYSTLSKDFMVRYDASGSIGKRYLRESESGTPFCITIDYDSLEDNSVTIRDRDTEHQKRVQISELKTTLASLIDGTTQI